MERDIETRCIHLDEADNRFENYGAISFPIYQTATYAHMGVGNGTGYDYSRLQNPTREHLEKIMASLEHGYDALAYSSGMAAISALMELFGIMGLVACEAAYAHGGEWYEAVLKYIKANIDYMREYVDNNIPGVHMSEHEGTYLVWLDFRDLGLSPAEQEHLIVDEAGLWLDGGSIFGKTGIGFERINVACPRATLKEALERIERAVKNLTQK